MKRTLRLGALILVVAMLALTLISCGPLGSYGSDDYTIQFVGSSVKVTAKSSLSGNEYTFKGKFEIEEKEKDGEKSATIDITFDALDDDAALEEKTLYAATKIALSGKKVYTTGKNDDGKYIAIGGIKYFKK